MTKQTFTEKFAELPNLRMAFRFLANECIKDNCFDGEDSLVQFLIDQYTTRGSREEVEQMLSPELLDELKLFVCDDIMGESHSMQMRLLAKTTKIAELKKIINDLKEIIEKLKKQIH